MGQVLLLGPGVLAVPRVAHIYVRQLLDAIPEGAGRAWLYVEPDGDVLPSQGNSGKVLGNLLRDEWKMIYS